MPSSRRTRCLSAATIACRARAGSATPLSAAHDCTIESIRQASLTCDPSGLPLSKYARRYQAPSQAFSSRLRRRRSASPTNDWACASSPR